MSRPHRLPRLREPATIGGSHLAVSFTGPEPAPSRFPLAATRVSTVAVLLGIGVLAMTVTADAFASEGRVPSRGGTEFLVALVAAFLLYAAASLLMERRTASLVAVLAVGAAIQLAPLTAPLLISADAYSYAAYGRVDAALGGNPYRDAPARFATDPVVGEVAGGWRTTPSVYGPAFAGLSAGVALLAGSDPAAAVRLYRIVAALSMVAVMCLAALLSSRPDRAAAFVGWNPLLAVHFAGGGHNDATMMALVLAALVLTSRNRVRSGSILWAVASAIKWIPIPLYALWALAARRRGERTGLAAFAGAALALGAVATWRYGTGWLRVATPLARAAEVQTHDSVVRRLEAAGLPVVVAIAVVGAAAAVGIALLVLSAWGGRAQLGLAAGLLVATSPWLLPWYVVWPVALSAVERGRGPRYVALGLTAYLLAARVAWG